MKLNKLSPNTIGLLQALGVAIYCGFIVQLLNFFGKSSIKPPEALIGTIMLMLLVISATITGMLVFGYPAILALNKEFKKALTIVGHTLLYAVLIFIIIVAIALI